MAEPKLAPAPGTDPAEGGSHRPPVLLPAGRDGDSAGRRCRAAERGKRARRGGPAQRPPRSRPVQKQPAEPAKTVAVNAEIVPRKLWPRIPVEEVLQHDPLKLPAFLAVNTGGSAVSEHDQSSTQAQTRANAEAEMRQRHAKLTLLQQQGVNVIVSGPHGTSAMIGARQVHVGDDIDGFVITEIRPDGVVLTDPIEK